MEKKRDELLEHEVDGIREFDNALPRWWLYGFYVTIAIGAIYFMNFHVLPRPLVGARTVVAEYEADVCAAAAAHPRAVRAVGAVAAKTDAASLARGDEIFHSQTNACFSCHRPDLGGLIGPNLTDAMWLHGCTAAALVHDVSTGFPDKGMLPFGTGAHLSDDDVLNVMSYVLSRQGSHPPNPKAVDPGRDKPCTP